MMEKITESEQFAFIHFLPLKATSTVGEVDTWYFQNSLFTRQVTQVFTLTISNLTQSLRLSIGAPATPLPIHNLPITIGVHANNLHVVVE